MPIKYHQHLCVSRLLTLGDEQLQKLFQHPEGVFAIKEGLVAMQKRGVHFVVLGECDNTNPDGSCAGHETPLDVSNEEASP
ncbi:hypothetical protein P7F88_08700 [Vibrio hannami]|uniref:hypothetical protein n=1 Tax=Vibrio hannami TaxID=2717094 RepID=UPI00240FD790|nr:hypothetical protein [Vibrio hannami]MDG3086176.1 hypothetical protein [Vibrio hannami]